MRFFRFILILTIAAMASTLSYGQSQVEDNGVQERVDPKSVSLYFKDNDFQYIHVRLGMMQATKVRLKLTNIVGSEFEIKSEVVSENEIRIRVADFTTGYYVLTIQDPKYKFNRPYRFCKQDRSLY
jgi:hypothetical protein